MNFRRLKLKSEACHKTENKIRYCERATDKSSNFRCKVVGRIFGYSVSLLTRLTHTLRFACSSVFCCGSTCTCNKYDKK